MTSDEDKLKRAYARLTALEKTVADEEGSSVRWSLAQELNGALQHLTDLSYPTEEFEMPTSERFRSAAGIDYYVNRSLLLTKVRSVINYFDLVHAEPPPQLGFTVRKPE